MSQKNNYYNIVKKIDIALSKDKVTNEMFELIKENPYEDYFFRNLESLKWFYSLKEKGYFNPQNAPCPKPADEKGYVTIPLWNVLPYLEKVSKQVNEPGNEKYIDELLNIIREVTRYHIKNNKSLDNYNTWTYFVRILLNIPNNKIPLDIIALIPIWLESHYAGSALANDLALELLPKFLPDMPSKEDNEKAEKIFEYMVEIKWKEGAKDFIETLAGVREEPYLVVDHYWLTESLINKKNVERIGKRCSDKLIFTVADKLKTVFRKQMNPSGFDVTIENVSYRVVVMHTKDFEFECFGGKIDEEKRKELEGHEKFFRKMLYMPEKQFKFVITNSRSGNNFTEQMILNLEAKNLGQIEDDFSNRMIQFYKSMFNDFSYIWYSNLDDVPDWIDSSSAKELLVLILKELIVAKVRAERSFGEKIINKFLGDSYQYPLFKRFALFVIGEFWSDFHITFEQIIKKSDINLWFDDINFETELYILLEKNISKFSTPIKNRLKEIINNGPQRSLPEENKEKYENYWKQKWFSALRADAEFAELYEHYHNLTKTREHISFKEPGVQTRSGPGSSPLSVEQIISMPNNEIAEFLATFKTKDWWKDPTEDALSDKLKESVKSQPEKFVDDLSPFLNISYKYINDLLWGLRDTWNNKRIYDWGKLLTFMKNYVNRNDFWQDKLPIAGDDWKPNHPWVISSVGNLIQEGTKDDSRAFDEKNNDAAIEIIDLILTDSHIADLKSNEKEENYLMDAINTPLGNIITGLIYLSLRIARLKDKNQTSDETKRWDSILKTSFCRTLEKEVVEAYTLLGQYLTNFMYLDKAWTKQNIQDIEIPKQEAYWKAFMTGYLNTIRVYDSIYKLPSMQRHYEKVLATMTDDKHINERIVHHITIGYLREDDSLFNKILAKWQPSQILEIIKFFSRKSEYLLKPDIENKDTLIPKIIDFWNKVYEKYKDVTGSLLSEDDKQILSEVTKLTIYLKEISEKEFDWVMLSSPFVHIDGNERWLLEYLDNLKDEGEDKIMVTKHILQIILKMLEHFVFGYAQEYMQSIITFAYELKDAGIKKMANDICNILGASGIDYLRKTYEKYNK